MNKNSFNIISATISGYQSALRNWRYLAGLGILPMSVEFVTTMLVQFEYPGMSFTEITLWSLPSTALYAWLMFQQTRLMVFGERMEKLPQEPASISERQTALRISILVWMIFRMAYSAVFISLMFMIPNMQAQEDSVYTFIAMLMIGASFWGVRFSVAHILAAVGYPVRNYIFRVNGVGISFRLLGLSLLSVLPFGFVAQEMLNWMLPEAETLSQTEALAGTFVACLMSLCSICVYNAAAVFAMKEMLGKPDAVRGVTA